MKIINKEGTLTFFPKKPTEELLLDTLRNYFENNDYNTDRVWSEGQIKNEEPLGLRINLK